MFPRDMQNIIAEINSLVTDQSLKKSDKSQQLADKLWEFELVQADFFGPDRVTITLDLPKDYVQLIDAIVEQKRSVLH